MLKVHNTLTRQTEEFVPLKPGEVKMYVCGPTVYGPGHIGHARTYTAFDLIRRYLEWKEYRVTYVVNITDIHDDMISQANKDGITIFQLAERNIKIFMDDLQALGIKRPTEMPRVTGHILEIIEMVKALQQKGFAYETDDGVYFKISKFSGYGRLSNIKVKKGVTGTRVETDKYEKENPMDFALWKKAKDGEPSWPSPWGEGRPGWHIECSAMSAKYLGKQFDIHGGAVDLVFPHHENEICQSEACFGVSPFVKYWLHAGFLNVGGEKMSKSLGNYITIPQLLEKFDPRAFRFFIAGLHYRSRVDFNDEAIARSAKSLERWDNTIQGLLGAQGTAGGGDAGKGRRAATQIVQNSSAEELIGQARAAFEKAMDEDFNLPIAWAGLYEFQSKINSLLADRRMSGADAEKAMAFLLDINTIFGFFSFEKKQSESLPANLQELVDRRTAAKKAKDFKEADRLREELRTIGIELLDTPEGVKWKRVEK